MNISIRSAVAQRRQRGVAAVELALMMPILLALLTVPLIVSIYFWHYTAAQKAAQNAARYLSTISVQEMRAGNLALAAEAIATQMAQTQVAELTLAASAPVVEVYCARVRCTGVGNRPLPQTIFVSVRMDLFDNFFFIEEVGRYGLPITAEVELPYVGN
jgi:Flp pilus assembly protein TadG